MKTLGFWMVNQIHLHLLCQPLTSPPLLHRDSSAPIVSLFSSTLPLPMTTLPLSACHSTMAPMWTTWISMGSPEMLSHQHWRQTSWGSDLQRRIGICGSMQARTCHYCCHLARGRGRAGWNLWTSVNHRRLYVQQSIRCALNTQSCYGSGKLFVSTTNLTYPA